MTAIEKRITLETTDMLSLLGMNDSNLKLIEDRFNATITVRGENVLIKGVTEEVVPDIKVTRSKSGNTGQAIFYFEDPQILSRDSTDEITGMYLVDDEGEIVSSDVKGKFVNGEARAIEATLVMKSVEEFDRFIRFMDKYAAEHGLGLDKS